MGRYSIDKIPSDVLEELAERHRLTRKAAGYSQAELATRAGVSLGSLKRFEHTGQVSLESLLKLLHVLNRLEDMNHVLAPRHLEDAARLFSDTTRR